MSNVIKLPLLVHVVDDKISSYPSTSSLIKWLGERAISSSFDDADIVIFRGGTDLSSRLYAKEPSFNAWKYDHARDLFELDAYDKARKQGKFIIGICRGAQLITICNGGRLIQHVNHHFGNHPVFCPLTKEVLITNSLHHQICWPYDTNTKYYEILAFSKPEYFSLDENTVRYTDEQSNDFFPLNSVKPLSSFKNIAEPEIIWFYKHRALAIQGHPENMLGDVKFAPYLNYINHIISLKLKQK